MRLPKGIDPSRFAGQIFELVSLKQEYATYSKAMQVRGEPRKKAITYKGCENVSSWRRSTQVCLVRIHFGCCIFGVYC